MARIASSNAVSAARRGVGSGLLISYSFVCGRNFPNYSAMYASRCGGAVEIGPEPLASSAPRAGFEPATQRSTEAYGEICCNALRQSATSIPLESRIFSTLFRCPWAPVAARYFLASQSNQLELSKSVVPRGQGAKMALSGQAPFGARD